MAHLLPTHTHILTYTDIHLLPHAGYAESARMSEQEQEAAAANAAAAEGGAEEEYRVMAERMKDEGNAAFKGGK